MTLSLEDIASLAYDGVTSALDLPAATLVKVILGSRVPGDLAAGTQSETVEYATVAVPEKRTAHDPQTLTRRQAATITLMSHPLTVAGVEPEAGDRVTTGGVTYQILDVQFPGGVYVLTVAGA